MLIRLIKLFIAIVSYILYRSMVITFSLCKKELPGTFVVLTYHSVKTHQRSQFVRHMDEILKRARPIFADHIIPLENNRHHVAVTFDDGFQSVLSNALPPMRERKIPATIFVPAAYLGKKPAWIPNPTHVNADEVVLTEEQLKQLQNDLTAIGTHSDSHPKLTEISEDRAIKELINSKKALEGILHRPIALLSLPYGEYNKTILELSQKAGYERVFRNIPTFHSSKTDDFLCGRIATSPDDWMVEYRLKLLGAYKWLPIAIIIKQKLQNLCQAIFARKRGDNYETTS